jgi:hypothetical protein
VSLKIGHRVGLVVIVINDPSDEHHGRAAVRVTCDDCGEFGRTGYTFVFRAFPVDDPEADAVAVAGAQMAAHVLSTASDWQTVGF